MYILCDPASGKFISACIKRNPNKADFSGTPYPNVNIRKAILPICQGKRRYCFELFDGYGNYPEAVERIGGTSGHIVLKNSTMKEEFDDACEEWNCLCGMQGLVSEYGECPGVINVTYSDNPKDFTTYVDGNPMSITSITAEAHGACDIYFSFGDETAATIVFNFTNEFLYNKHKPSPTDIQIRGFINEEYAINANTNSILKNVKLYYYKSTALHEIEHILGLTHYNITCLSGGSTQLCNEGTEGKESYGIIEDKDNNDPHYGLRKI
jgi:hypothetical protein